MIVSYNWLRELTVFPYTPAELADVLTKQGMTVDSLQKRGAPYTGIVTGELIEVKPHPKADKLTVCRVNTGTETVQIVCGAPGLKTGQKIPVALPGARIGDVTIQKTSIRGIESCGMCCAADELGISDNHDTLLYLEKEMEAGKAFEDLVHGEDYLLELDIPGNRPDLLSHTGVAREIAAQMALTTGEAAAYLPASEVQETGEETANRVRVEIRDKELCPRYTARVIDTVKIGQSPPGMQARLYALGMRPINIVVDITNYVLLEYGQPLHAFDYAKVEGGGIIVRRAEAGERIITLDEEERQLDGEMLLIADSRRGLALAGVMGGSYSAISDDTQTILLESAYFNGANIRRTSRQLGLQSESSYRFERNVRGSILAASNRAAGLLARYAGGTVLQGIVDTGQTTPENVFTFNYTACGKLMGIAPGRDRAKTILTALGFSLDDGPDTAVEVRVPVHRIDIAEGPDIAEELARMTGYDTIPLDSAVHFRSELPVLAAGALRKRLRGILTGMGLREAYNPSLISHDLLSKAGVPDGAPEYKAVPLANASTQEQSIMRTVLYPGLLRNVKYNIAHGADAVMLYEIGRVYTPAEDGRNFMEKEKLGIVLWGEANKQGWNSERRECDYFDGAGIIEGITTGLNISGCERRAGKRPGFHPGRTADILIGDMLIGYIGEIEPQLLRASDIRGRVVIGELDCELLAEAWNQDRKYKTLPRFPASTRDIALVVSNEHAHEEIMGVIEGTGIEAIETIRLFDVYRGEQVPEGKKSMAYRVVYRATDRTLTDEDVDGAHRQVIEALASQLQAQIR